MSRKKQTPNQTNSPPLPLSRDRVLQSALQLADQDGLEALSMRNLAQKLGVQAMSLYNHVANKDDLIDGIVDLVVGEIVLPKITPDWQSEMRKRAISAHQVLLNHPWATLPLVSRINVGPAMLRYIDATLGCLREAGFSWEMADHAWNTIDSHVYGFTLQELNFPIAAEDYATTAQAFLPMIPPDQYPYMHALTQEVITKRYDGLHTFELGLDLLLAGLDQLRDRKSPI
ncbi:TetR/AcrR family transcriptional regulator C-terminal domain-containing protein [Alkalinema pantanalense CENA528]|uniref:TetR/AcrR family transcriptional regulator C-terminal domain-containing protein n=1 Tax=Alkalinema pantanalense TaxID=1620705 RepID=UPI003D6ECB54